MITLAEANKELTADDIEVSATALMIKDYLNALKVIDETNINRILDIGCGFGGITKTVGKFFAAEALYGVDIDEERVAMAKSRGIVASRVDIGINKLPYREKCLDLVVSNGVIEHLPYYDNLITEAYRVLKLGGYLLITLPNLANYIQRISLLLGYQPSDVNISKEIYTGTIFYSGQPSQGHIHSATAGAMKQLLEYYRFTVISIKKGNPKMTGTFSKWALLFRIVGYLCPVSLARRIIIISRKGN